MFRRPMVRRRCPGLVGTVARTAVIAGTATAVSGAMVGHQQEKQAEAATAQQAQADTAQNSADMAAMQQQVSALQAQQLQQAAAAAPAAAPVAAPTPAPVATPAPAAPDLMTQLQELAAMKTAGVLTDEEFTAAKAKLLS